MHVLQILWHVRFTSHGVNRSLYFRKRLSKRMRVISLKNHDKNYVLFSHLKIIKEEQDERRMGQWESKRTRPPWATCYSPPLKLLIRRVTLDNLLGMDKIFSSEKIEPNWIQVEKLLIYYIRSPKMGKAQSKRGFYKQNSKATPTF